MPINDAFMNGFYLGCAFGSLITFIIYELISVYQEHKIKKLRDEA